MDLHISTALQKGMLVDIFPVHTIQGTSRYPCTLAKESIEEACVGAYLSDENGVVLRVLSKRNTPAFLQEDTKGLSILQGDMVTRQNTTFYATNTLQCVVMRDIPQGTYVIRVVPQHYTFAWITLSDKGSSGKRKDTSGPLIGKILREHLPISLTMGNIIPDEPSILESLVLEYALQQRYNLIVTTGGTGIAPRDNTAKVMERILHSELLGFEVAMLQESMKHVSTALISRAKAGIIAKTLIINLPGSPNAVEQNIKPLLPMLSHAMDKLLGDETECADRFLYKNHP